MTKEEALANLGEPVYWDNPYPSKFGPEHKVGFLEGQMTATDSRVRVFTEDSNFSSYTVNVLTDKLTIDPRVGFRETYQQGDYYVRAVKP